MMVEELAQMILYWNSSYQIKVLVDFRLIHKSMRVEIVQWFDHDDTITHYLYL